MREPLLDWQREGRMLKDPRTGNSQSADGAADMHIAAKVCMLLWMSLLQAASNTSYTMIIGSSSLLKHPSLCLPPCEKAVLCDDGRFMITDLRRSHFPPDTQRCC